MLEVKIYDLELTYIQRIIKLIKILIIKLFKTILKFTEKNQVKRNTRF